MEREPSALRTPLSPVGGARASYHLAAHLQPGRSAGMAGSRLLPLALAVLLLVRARDSSVFLVVTGKLVEENGVTPGDSGAGGTGLGPSQTPAGLVPTPEGHLSWDTGQ